MRNAGAVPDEDLDDNVGGVAELNRTEGVGPVAAQGGPAPRLSPKKQDDLIQSFHKKFERWLKFEGTFIRQYNDDMRFTHADSENLWQWDEMIASDRGDKPTLTMNYTRIHCYLITNEMRRSPPSIMVKPTGLGADGESAKTVGGLIREIQRVSNAIGIYVKAGQSMVKGGVGYWRVVQEWENEKSMLQVIRIRSIADQTACGLDPSAKEPNGADANWGFIYEDIPNEEAEELYPRDADDVIGTTNAITGTVGADRLTWVTEKHTRVLEWFERELYNDELVAFDGEGGEQVIEYASKMDREVLKKLLEEPLTQRRKVQRKRIMWYKIVGDRIIDHHEIAGDFIPIVRVAGEEVVIEGELDRKGLTRNLKDPQRNMNYWMSSAAEQVALQTKAPFIGPKKAFENNPQWANANTENYAYIPFNDYDEENKREIKAPERPQQPVMADAYIKGLQLAEAALRNISGQHENTQGKEDNAISGRAILARKASGDVATYNYPDELASGVMHTGRIILSMTPVVYDTPRMLRITHQDMKQEEVRINPASPVAQRKVPSEKEENTEITEFNPSIGTYDLDVQSGPDFATQRQWLVEALSQIIGQNEEMWKVFGDLFVKNMDFPGADEIAERIRRIIPPAVLGEGPSPGEQALTQQVEQMTKLLQSMTESLAEAQRKLEQKDEELTLRAVDSETKRIKEIGNAQENYRDAGLGAAWQQVGVETLRNAMGDPDPSALAQAHDAENDPQAPDPFAPDPSRAGPPESEPAAAGAVQ